MKQLKMLVTLVIVVTASSLSYAEYTHEVLHAFSGADGANPQDLIMDEKGNLYGTTSGGGTYGYGTVFKLDTTGHLTVLYSFAGGTDGTSPSNLILDAGNLYGTTAGGGAHGFGKVFELATTGLSQEKVLYSFTGGVDGTSPSGLILDTGNLYGTASGGGAYGNGTIFELDSTDKLTVLHSFAGGLYGANPESGVVLDAAGNLYGTAGGGTNGTGTIFKLDTKGEFTVLFSFPSCSSLVCYGGPSGLILDTADNLYGTTSGLSGECLFKNNLLSCGTVYELTSAGAYRLLVRFNKSDGALPDGGLFRDVAGNLYGTTAAGGAYPYLYGTAFKVSGSSVTVLYNFTSADGRPVAGVILDANGNIYGTTTNGGAHGLGTVYKLIP